MAEEPDISEVRAQLSVAEEKIIQLSSKCAELMTKELKAGPEADSLSLGSAGSFNDNDSIEVKTLKDKLLKVKQSEELLKAQLESVQSVLKIMVHPEEISSKEKELKKQINDLEHEINKLQIANMNMVTDISEVEELKIELKRMRDIDERKTSKLEELHEKLDNYEKQNKVLMESLQEAETSEQSLRDSLKSHREKSEEAMTVVLPENVREYEEKEQIYLRRLNSLEQQDQSLRKRLDQLEKQEKQYEEDIERLKDELALQKELNAEQEQAILDLQTDKTTKNEVEAAKKEFLNLQEKYSNLKTILSQKMDELKLAREINTTQETTIKQLQVDMSASELRQWRQRAQQLEDELKLAKDINSSQEETIRQIQTQPTHWSDSDDGDLTASYQKHLNKQLRTESPDEVVMEYQQEIAGLREEVDQLNKKASMENEKHVHELSVLNKQMSTIQDELNKAESKAKIASNVIEELKTQNKKLSVENKKEYEEKIKDLSMKLQAEKVQNTVHRDVIDSLSPQMEKLKCDNEALETKLQTAKDRLTNAENEAVKYKSESESLKTKLSGLERKLEDQKEDLVKLLSLDPAKLKLDLETKTMESDNLAVDLIQMTDKLSDAEKKLSSLENKLASLQTEKREIENDRECLSGDLIVLKDKLVEAEKSSKQLDAAHKELEEHKQECERLRQLHCELKTRYEPCGEEVQEQMENILSDRVDEVEKMNQELDAGSEVHQVVSISNESTQGELKAAEILMKECERCKQQISVLESRCQELSSQQNYQQEQYSEKCSQLKSLEDSFAQLQSDYAKISKDYEETTRMKTELEEKVCELERLIQENCVSTCTECESKQHQIHSLQAELNAPCVPCDDKEKENAKQAGLVEEQKSHAQMLVIRLQDLEQELTSLKSAKAETDMALESAKQGIINYTERVSEVTAALQTQEELVKERDQQLQLQHNLTASLKSKIEELEEKSVSYQSQINSLESQLSSKLNLSAEADQTLSELHAHLTEKEAAVQSAEKTIVSLRQQVNQFSQEKSAAVSKNDKLVLELDGVISEKKVYYDEITSLGNELKSLKEELKSRDSKLQGAQSECKSLLADKQSIEDKLNLARENKLKLQSQVDELLISKASLEEQLAQVSQDRDSLKDKSIEQSSHSDHLKAQIITLEKQVEEGRRREQTLEGGVIAQLKTKVDELNKSKALLEKELDSLSLTLNEITQERDSLVERVDDQSSDTDSLQIQITELQQKLAAQDSLENSERQVKKDLEEKLFDGQKKLAEAEAALREAKQTITEAENKGIYVANKLKEKHEAELKSLQEQVEDLKIECDDLRLKVGSLKKTKSDENSNLQELQMENQRLAAELCSLQDDQIETLTSNSAEVSILKAQLENSQEHIQHLNDQLKLMEGLKTLSSELQNRLKEEKTVHESTTLELGSLKQEQLSFKEKLADMREQHEHAQLRCEELLSNLKGAKEELRETKDEMATRVLQLTQDRDALETSLNTLQDAYDREKAAHAKTIEKFRLDRGCLTGALADIDPDTEGQVTDVAQDNAHPQNEQDEEQITLPTDTAEDGESTIPSASSSDDSGDDIAGDGMSSNPDYEDQFISVLKDENRVLSEQNGDLSGRIGDLYDQMNDMTAKVRRMESLQSELLEAQQEVENLKAINGSSEKRIDELSNLLNIMESSKHCLLDELKSVKDENIHLESENDAKNQLAIEKQALEADLEQIRAECINLEKVIQQVRDENVELHMRLKSSKVDMSSEEEHEVCHSSGRNDDLESLRRELKEKAAKIVDLEEAIDIHKTYHAAAELAIEDKVTSLTLANKEKDHKCNELSAKIEELEAQLSDLQADDGDSESEDTDYQLKWQRTRNHLDALQFDYESLEKKYEEISDARMDLTLQLSQVKGERDKLTAQLRASPRMDETNADGVEYRGFQRKIIELKQQVQSQSRKIEELEGIKSDFDRKLAVEREATRNAETEVKKLQSSIELLMSTHKTEMSSLQKALQKAGSQMGELEVQVSDYSRHSESVKDLMSTVNGELQDIKASKEQVTLLVNDLVTQNTAASKLIHDHLLVLVEQIQRNDQSMEERTSNLSTSLPMDPPAQVTNNFMELPPMSSSPIAQLYSTYRPSSAEPFTPRAQYASLDKEDLINRLCEQTKHELLLKRGLEECHQSLDFYRSAIDNIIDCLGTAMPDIQKWARNMFSSEENAFDRQLEELITNDSALQRRVYALEMSEKALRESFDTKEKEYQSAILKLEDMVSVLKKSRSQLSEALTKDTTVKSSEIEMQVSELREKCYELETAVQKLQVQNEDLQFAYEQECERRQYQEEERFKADQRSRLSTLDNSKENEYLAKISSLEQKITNLVKMQQQLENTIERLKRDSSEDDLKLQIENLERSERALLRKIEILQQSENRTNSAQYDNTYDQPEDLLRQRIWEMERMETHLRQQISDLEHDREELHEIARGDKNTIHELNIQLAEAYLSSKNLKAQVARFEQAEEALYSKLDSAEAKIAEMEDRLQQAFDSEKTMRFQLEDVEYSEDSLRYKTEALERKLEASQANETLLKKRLDELNANQSLSVGEVSSFRSKIRDLESELSLLRNQLHEGSTREINLKGKISELAAVEASLQMRVKEVELENERLRTRLLQSEKSASSLRGNISDTFLSEQELKTHLQTLRDSEKQAKQRISKLETEKFELEKKYQDVNINYIQLKKQLNKDEIDGERVTAKLQAALNNEAQAKAQVRQLEGVVAAHESRKMSGVVERENFQLNSENKNLQEKLRGKEREVRDLEDKVSKLTAQTDPKTSGGTYRISKLTDEVNQLKTKLNMAEGTRKQLEDTIQSMRGYKVSCGHEAEIMALKQELSYLRTSQNQTRLRQESSGNIRPIPSSTVTAVKKSSTRSPSRSPVRKAPDSLHKKCMNELLFAVQNKADNKHTELVTKDDDRTSVVTMEELEIASQNSLWDKLEPPKKLDSPLSPKPLKDDNIESLTTEVPAAAAVRPSTPTYADSIISASDVNEESSLWEKLELLETKKSDAKTAKVEIIFDDGPIAPVYCPRRAPSPNLLGDSLLPVSSREPDVPTKPEESSEQSEDEVSDIESEQHLPPHTDIQHEDRPDSMDPAQGAHQPLSVHAAMIVEMKDIARLKQVILELERKLTSRETEIKMLRNQQKEIEKEIQASGDVMTLRSKLKELQDQAEDSEKKISKLRNEIIARDRNLETKQKEIVDLRLQVRRHAVSDDKASTDNTEVERQGGLSPGARQRPIQMCTSPGRQTTIEKDPGDLYKSMLDSKDSHIQHLTKQLDEKKVTIAKLEKDLIDMKVEKPAAESTSTSLRMKYLDDKYTEAATKCYNLKMERDELQKRFDALLEEHSKCNQSASPSSVGKCKKCKELKREVRRLQKELHSYKKKLARKVLETESLKHEHEYETDSSVTLTHSEIYETDSLADDVVNYILSSSQQLQNSHTSSISCVTPSSTPTAASSVEKKKKKLASASSRKRRVTYYEAISDYNPQLYSTSNRVAEELPLKKGQKVKALTDVDETGYLKIEVDGATGIVPIKYLHPVDLDKMEAELLKSKRRAHLDKLSGRSYSKQTATPLPVSQAQQSTPLLNQSLPLSGPISTQNHSRTRSMSPLRPTHVETTSLSNIQPPVNHTHLSIRTTTISPDRRVQCKPRAPSDLRVEIVANQKLYIEWSYIQLIDHSARSNGTQVNGFRIFLNGRPVVDISSPYTTVTSIDVTPSQLEELHTVSIQTLGANNLNSSLTHTSVTANLSPINSDQRMHTQAMKESKLKKSNGKDVANAKRRLFMAYYDYDPSKQGPYSRGLKKSYDDELFLSTGDFIVVHGDVLPNGYYSAELNGKQGYVPEAFIRQVPAENARHYGFHDNDVYLS